MNWLERYLGGHIAFRLLGRKIVIYGFNAMHVAINIYTKRFGFICFHPPMRCFGGWYPWYFYLSPNATQWAATFAIGPGVDREDKRESIIRREKLGHNFDVWNMDYTQYRFPRSIANNVCFGNTPSQNGR